jgi:acyl-CoA synthetase (AMP-forming)/AMP-acid ligase II
MGLPDRLKAVAAIDPEHWAFEREGRRIAWRKLSDTASRLDLLVRAAGVDDGAAIFVVMGNRLESVLSVLATLLADRPAVYVNALLPEDARASRSSARCGRRCWSGRLPTSRRRSPA